MKIYGIRIYPQSVEVDRSGSSPIFVHGRVSDDCSDFFYTFRPLAPLWRSHYFANEFTGSYEDPMPGLREQFGSSLIAADSQFLLLHGDGFARWGNSLYFCEGALLPIFRETPDFKLVRRLYHDDLISATWPGHMRALLHMWDDIYWQLFTTERSDLDFLIRAHAGDTRLKMYYVDFDREFPDPSNLELKVAALSD